MSSLKARAGLIYLRHPKHKAMVCPRVPPPPLASHCSTRANERPPCKWLSARSAEHCHPPPTLAFRWTKSPRTGLNLCICITDIHPHSKQGNCRNTPRFHEGPHRVFPQNVLWGKAGFPQTSVQTTRSCSPFPGFSRHLSNGPKRSRGSSCSVGSGDLVGWSLLGSGKSGVLLIISTPWSDV